MRLGNSSNTTLLVRLKAQKSQAVFLGDCRTYSSKLFFCSIFFNSFPKNLLIYMLCSVIPSRSHLRYIWLSGGVMECWLWWNCEQQCNVTSEAAYKCYKCHILTCIEKACWVFKTTEIIANVSFSKKHQQTCPLPHSVSLFSHSPPLLVEN